MSVDVMQALRAIPQPGYWMHETSGILRPAVEAYLRQEPMIAGPWMGEHVEALRDGIDSLTTRQAIKAWLDLAMLDGIDPL